MTALVCLHQKMDVIFIVRAKGFRNLYFFPLLLILYVKVKRTFLI